MEALLNDIIIYFDGFFWFWLFNTRLLLVAILIIILIIFLVLIKLLKTKKLKNQENLIYQYDNIVYLVSWYNYQTWTNDASLMFKEIFSNKQPSYMANHKLIFNSIQKLEKEFWKKIIPEEHWNTINKLTKKVKFFLFLFKLLKIIAIIILLLLVLWILYFFILK